MRKINGFDEFLSGKLSLVSLFERYQHQPSEELFVQVASLSDEQRQRLRDAVFAAALLTAIVVHEECPLVEFGRFVQRQIQRVEALENE